MHAARTIAGVGMSLLESLYRTGGKHYHPPSPIMTVVLSSVLAFLPYAVRYIQGVPSFPDLLTTFLSVSTFSNILVYGFLTWMFTFCARLDFMRRRQMMIAMRHLVCKQGKDNNPSKLDVSVNQVSAIIVIYSCSVAVWVIVRKKNGFTNNTVAQ
jgi:hypothetical protein